MKFVLPKNEILRDKKEFNRIFSIGRWVKGRFLVLYFLPSEERKVGFAVSKKVSTNVEKNRIRRRLRELYRLNKDLFPENGHFIILGFKDVSDCSWSDLQRDLRTALRELRENLG